MAKASVTSYRIDTEVRKAVKAFSAKSGIQMRRIVEDALREYLEKRKGKAA